MNLNGVGSKAIERLHFLASLPLAGTGRREGGENLSIASNPVSVQGGASSRGYGFGWQWSRLFHHHTLLLCQYCRILICPSRIWLTVEQPLTKSTQPKSVIIWWKGCTFLTPVEWLTDTGACNLSIWLLDLNFDKLPKLCRITCEKLQLRLAWHSTWIRCVDSSQVKL